MEEAALEEEHQRHRREAGSPTTTVEASRARLLLADQVLQQLIVQFGLAEDWEARLIHELNNPDETDVFEDSSDSIGPNMTLRRMRRTGPLAELDESAQSTLLGSTLYQYSREVPAVRAAEARLQATGTTIGTSAASDAGATVGASDSTQVHAGSGRPAEVPPLALANLRRGVVSLLQGSRSPDSGGSEVTNSLASTAVMLPGQNLSGPDLTTTLGLLEGHLSRPEEPSGSRQSSPSHRRGLLSRQEEPSGSRQGSPGPRTALRGHHLSPLEEADASMHSSYALHSTANFSDVGLFQGDLGETQGSVLGSLQGGLLLRAGAGSPDENTHNSWELGSDRLDQTGHTVFSGTVNALQEGDRTGMFLRLLNAADLDESLVRSVRRVLQLGSVLIGDRLSEQQIENLPKVHFNQTDEQQCSICLEAFETGELLTALPCCHFFHVSCISKWFHQSARCPLCRTPLNEEDSP